MADVATANPPGVSGTIVETASLGLPSMPTGNADTSLTSLLSVGHSLIVVEHSPDVMACADWIIDLGPGAGDEGGRVVAQGPPEDVARADTPTGRVLAARLGG